MACIKCGESWSRRRFRTCVFESTLPLGVSVLACLDATPITLGALVRHASPEECLSVGLRDDKDVWLPAGKGLRPTNQDIGHHSSCCQGEVFPLVGNNVPRIARPRGKEGTKDKRHSFGARFQIYPSAELDWLSPNEPLHRHCLLTMLMRALPPLLASSTH
jgi:hypothetical protein